MPVFEMGAPMAFGSDFLLVLFANRLYVCMEAIIAVLWDDEPINSFKHWTIFYLSVGLSVGLFPAEKIFTSIEGGFICFFYDTPNRKSRKTEVEKFPTGWLWQLASH